MQRSGQTNRIVDQEVRNLLAAAGDYNKKATSWCTKKTWWWNACAVDNLVYRGYNAVDQGD